MGPLAGEASFRPTYTSTAVVRAVPGRTVYRSDHEVFKGPCIQKMVELIGLPDALLLTEPELMNTLDHDHIVKVREAQFDPNDQRMITYVMPFYAGGSVESVLGSGGTFSVGTSIRLVLHLVDALSYLHNTVGYLHRDVKPGNLLLDGSYSNGYLTDFGSAAKLGGGPVAVRGFTLPYLDPEARSTGCLTVQSDVYAAGMTLFEMLSGALWPKFDPVKGTARLTAGKRAYPDSMFTFVPQVPKPLRRVVRKAIHPVRGSRHASAADFATALSRAERRCIDWSPSSAVGAQLVWEGTWPSDKPLAARRHYRVTATPGGGRRAGEWRLLAAVQTSASCWRGFGGLDAWVAAGDFRAVAKFFDRVDEKVAQTKAAR